MFSLIVHDDAKADIDGLWRRAPKVAAMVIAFLQQVKTDQDLLDRFTQRHYVDDRVDIDHFEEQWRKRRNLWRLKIIPLEELGYRYRIIYAFSPIEKRYFILGVFHRDFNYIAEDERTKRVVAAYGQLNIPEY